MNYNEFKMYKEAASAYMNRMAPEERAKYQQMLNTVDTDVADARLADETDKYFTADGYSKDNQHFNYEIDNIRGNYDKARNNPARIKAMNAAGQSMNRKIDIANTDLTGAFNTLRNSTPGLNPVRESGDMLNTGKIKKSPVVSLYNKHKHKALASTSTSPVKQSTVINNGHDKYYNNTTSNVKFSPNMFESKNSHAFNNYANNADKAMHPEKQMLGPAGHVGRAKRSMTLYKRNRNRY